ncbi:sensor histidine kinase [Streptomyces sp. NPDC021100]|uniref:sensor histidine kinase n=1 Tax=Streptomyces sp. NPDC021100 TaxID=3365114 RepID=UPI0037A418FA
MSRAFSGRVGGAGVVGEAVGSKAALVGATVGLLPLFGLLTPLFGTGGRPGRLLVAGAALVLFGAVQVAVGWSYRTARFGARFRSGLLLPLAAAAVVLPLWLGREWTLLLPYLASSVAVAVPPRLCVPALAGTVGLAYAVAERVDPAGGVPTVLLTAGVGMAMATYRRILDLNAELRRTRRELARSAVAEERLRFARDVHDVLGHSLLRLILHTEVTRRLHRVGETDVEAELRKIEDLGRQALERVREAVSGYRRLDVCAVVEEARPTLTDAGVTLAFDAGADELPEEVETVLGWVVRESLSNVVKHAGADRCTVTLRVADRQAVLDVRDDGSGRGRPGRAGNGLTGLTERVTALGGRLHAGNAPGGGFRVRASVPLEGAR